MSAAHEPAPAAEATTALIALDTANDIEKRSPGSRLIEEAKAIEVTSAETREAALAWTKRRREQKASAVELFADPKKKAHDAHKAICLAETRTVKPFDEGIAIVTKKVEAFDAEQERIREEEQRRLEAQARKVEEDRRLAEAASAVENGMPEAEAMTALEAPMSLNVELPPAVPKSEGAYYHVTFSAVVTSKATFLAYVAAHPEWFGLVEVNQGALNRIAASQAKGFQFPGCALKTDKSLRQRAR